MSKAPKIDINHLQFSQHEEFLQQKYLVPDLKILCEKWGLSKKGKKQELKDLIYKHMVMNSSPSPIQLKKPDTEHAIIRIQKWVRSIFPRLYILNKYEMLTPRHDRTTSLESENSIVDDVAPCQSIFQKIAEYERKCIVENDFLTIEPIKDLPHYQRIMFRENNLIYGFDLSSFYQYMERNDVKLQSNEDVARGLIKQCQNPYTRQHIRSSLILGIRRHIRLCRILKFPIKLTIHEVEEPENTVVSSTPTQSNIYVNQNYGYYMKLNLSQSERLHRRVADLFQYFDTFGNYTNTRWFLELSFSRTCGFIRELKDIWEYRSQLTPEVRQNICPNSHVIHSVHNPFFNIHPVILHNLYQSAATPEMGLQRVKHRVLNVLDRMTKYGINNDYKAIAVTFVLSALTIVSEEAAVAMPWLYSTVA